MSELWTAEQHAAIRESRHLLLAANAGTGKTSTVVGKILWSLGFDVGDAEDGPIARCAEPCDLSQVAAITFTEKAARDLRRKLSEALEANGIARGGIDRAFVGTIHGFCGDILRQHALRLDIDPSFRVMDAREASLRLGELTRETILEALESGERDVIELLKDAPLDRYGEFGPSVTGLVRRSLHEIRWNRENFDRWLREPDDTGADRTAGDLWLDPARFGTPGQPEAGPDPGDEEAEARHLSHLVAVYRLAYRVLGRWLTLLERENRRDFDSLILDVRRLLTHERFGSALEEVRRRFRLLIVDEFQDTDRAQRDIAFAIGGLIGPPPAPGEETRLFLVGDPKQSIYGFRNADVRVWNEVENRFRQAGAVLRLGRNFRSDPVLVRLVNEACTPAFGAAGSALEFIDPGAVIRYDPLDPGREPKRGAGVDWLATPSDLNKAERKAFGAALLAGRIERLLDRRSSASSRSPSEAEAVARADEIAVLAARADTLSAVEEALHERGIPTYNASSRGLAQRQEVLDAINALRLADNPLDDVRAFAFLRSPFVGLRDEVIARIQLDRSVEGRGLLERAAAWLAGLGRGDVEPFDAPEHQLIGPTERFALRRGLETISEVCTLVGRAAPAELLDTLLERTSYRLHLRLRPGAREAVANLDRLRILLDQFQFLSLADFLRAWDQAAADGRTDLETAVPPAAAEGAVFLSTIHGAKGLEWPIVAIAGAEDGFRTATPGRWEGWLDSQLGPVLLPPSKERGPRSQHAVERRVLGENAESMRLLYVALTRARDRLLVVAPIEEPGGHAEWVAQALFKPAELHDMATLQAEPRDESSSSTRAPETDDPSTRTGRQLDAFGLNEPPADEVGQLNLLSAENYRRGLEESRHDDGADPATPVRVWRSVDPIQPEFAEVPLTLEWLSLPTQGELPAAVLPSAVVTAARLRSATELSLASRDPDGWRLRYRHGVVPVDSFDAKPVRGGGGGDSAARGGLPGRVRGSLVHEVLERIEDDLEDLLEEVIEGIGEEGAGSPGGVRRLGVRERLRSEIENVLASDAWREWVSSEHYREISFVHFAGPDDWRQGRIDLFVPPRPGDPGVATGPLIVDFKTDRVGEEGTDPLADRYRTQARVYREAIDAILGGSFGSGAGPAETTRVILYFTETGDKVMV
ncbi:MAG: UvrD-helicase domain-containing protein [marine benthic group bacterium]|nr:UvrD-helicase domain-containing protein [Gemmatimonadota bacterium]